MTNDKPKTKEEKVSWINHIKNRLKKLCSKEDEKQEEFVSMGEMKLPTNEEYKKYLDTLSKEELEKVRDRHYR